MMRRRGSGCWRGCGRSVSRGSRVEGRGTPRLAIELDDASAAAADSAAGDVAARCGPGASKRWFAATRRLAEPVLKWLCFIRRAFRC